MTKPRRSPNRAIIAATAAGALLIGGAVAFAAPSAPTLTDGPGVAPNSQYTKIANPTFTWSGGAGGLDTFAWAVDAQPSVGTAASGTSATIPAQTDGSHIFRVAEAGDINAAPDPEDALSPPASVTFFVDTVIAPLGRSLSATVPSSGWFRSAVSVSYSCEVGSATASGVENCPADETFSGTGSLDEGAFPLATTQTDRALNTSSALAPLTLRRDATPPKLPQIAGPTGITNTLTPAFEWSAVDDETPSGVNEVSGFNQYRFTLMRGQGGSGTQVEQLLLSQPMHTPSTPLLNNTDYSWRVEALDLAGNARPTDWVDVRVDITAPDDPSFSQGPTNGSATNDSTPTFTFTGVAGATFTWETRNSLDELVTGPGFAGTGALGTVTLPTLPDGTYTFKVKQKAPNNKESGFAAALFTVDTTAPAAPTINSSPGTTTNAQPSFGWSAAEQDGTFVWEVTGVGGIRVQGPGEAAAAAVSLPTSLVAGNYAFRVRQRDRAGNLSDWSAGEPFTIVNPQDPGPGPGPGGGTSGFRPSTRNAKALLPKVGVKVKPAATTLRWKKTRGATLYNLQVFRIDGTTYRKVHSAFPRGLKYKVPKKVLKSGRRYVWRVWPYLGKKKKYTPAPFGISWFDAK